MYSFAQSILDAPLGQTHLFSAGQAGFILKSASGQLLGIDLYLSDCAENFYGHAGFKRLLPKLLAPEDLDFDVLVATHPHLDHFDKDAIPGLMQGRATHLYCSVECEALVHETHMDGSAGPNSGGDCSNTDAEDACAADGVNDCTDRITYVTPGTDAVCGDFTLHFINCDHGTGAPDAVGVIVEVDGHLFAETGDTCLRLDRAAELSAFGTPDILTGPINGAYGNMNELDFAALCDAVRPGLAIPCHYGLFAIHGGNPGIFLDEMNRRELPCLLMAQGEMYRF